MGKYSRAQAMDFLFDALASSRQGNPDQDTGLEASCPGKMRNRSHADVMGSHMRAKAQGRQGEPAGLCRKCAAYTK